MQDNNSTDYEKICKLEKVVISVLVWVFFLPVKLIFYALKHDRFRILILMLAFILSSLYITIPSHLIEVSKYRQDTSYAKLLTPADLSAKVPVSDTPSEQISELVTDTSEAVKKEENEQSEIVYITKSGTKYHTADCYVLKDNGIPKELDTALLLGYTPCKKCHK